MGGSYGNLGSGLRGTLAAAMLLTAALAGSVQAQVDPNSGIDFVTIGAVGNAPWLRGPVGALGNQGRGTVNYEYAIGRTEITTAQWTEFFNAAGDRPSTDRLPWVTQPTLWGAVDTTPTVPGGRRWTVPAGNEMRAAGGITWRTAAMYCNWLHNNKATNREAFLSGAYDVSTFGVIGTSGVLFSDQLTRSPGARYWIPSVDEWMKAAHYDPSKVNEDGTVGGWWKFVHSRDDRAPIYGPPGYFRNGLPTEANAAWNTFTPQINPFTIPLGAYPTMTSPWGLLDTSGATAEWTEEAFQESDERGPRERYTEGGRWGSGSQFNDEAVFRSLTAWPDAADSLIGFRIATVPTPGCGGMVVALTVSSLAIRRRRNHAEQRS
jgi:formylglycine-generating enzyme required for sulfatase activity